MKAATRKSCLSVFILLTLASTTHGHGMEGIPVPNFNAANCTDFRRQLLNHTLLSFYDRKHATKLGIAGVSLFWTGLPAIALGIAAAWTGKRQSTAAVEELLLRGVTDDNFQEINRLCAILLRTAPVKAAALDGRNGTALILGAVSTALASLVFITQSCYGAFGFWKPNSYDWDRDLVDDVENMVSKEENRRSETDGQMEQEDVGLQG